jgi:hypothetical protein
LGLGIRVGFRILGFRVKGLSKKDLRIRIYISGFGV